MKRLLFILALFITFNLSAQHGVTSVYNTIQGKLMAAIMTFSDSTIEIEVEQQGNWCQITNYENNAFSYVVELYGVDCAMDAMELDIMGKYIFLANISFRGTAQPTNWDFSIKVGDSLLVPHPERSTNAVGQSGNVSIFSIYNCSMGQKAILQIRNNSNDENPIIKSATLIAIRVGDFDSSNLAYLPIFLLFGFIKHKKLV